MKINENLSVIALAASMVSSSLIDPLEYYKENFYKDTTKFDIESKVTNIWDVKTEELYFGKTAISYCRSCGDDSECRLNQADTIRYKWEDESQSGLDLASLQDKLSLNSTIHTAFGETAATPHETLFFKGPGYKRMVFEPKYTRKSFWATIETTVTKKSSGGLDYEHSADHYVSIRIPMKNKDGNADGKYVILDCFNADY